MWPASRSPSEKPLRIVGFGDRDPSLLTHREIDAALDLLPAEVDCGWVASDSPQARDLAAADGVWLLPGSPYRDDTAAMHAVRHCLRTGTPFLGTCAGFQYACVELAASRAGIAGATHAESDAAGGSAVVTALACTLYGETRRVVPVAGTRLAAICGSAPFDGFHFCGYGLADDYVRPLAASGVVISARAPDAGVEGIELADHPFSLATAFQPQVGASTSGSLHPLIGALVEAARARSAERGRMGEG